MSSNWNEKGMPRVVLHLKGLLWQFARELTAKGKGREAENLVRKMFQKSRLVIIVALPGTAEVEVVIKSSSTFGR